MGSGSAKKTPSKASRSSAQARRSPSKALKNEGSPVKTQTPRSRSAKKAGREYNYTSRLPTEQQRRENGRVPGRSLIVWGRPRMAEKLLLHLQYECSRHKIELPWDSIAHRLHPGSTGAAVSQHLGRLRRELTAEGHLVPPMLQRPGVGGAVDPDIRGFVRKDDEGDDKLSTRPVRFSEKHDDRRFNLPDAFDIQDQLPTISYDEEGDSDGDDLPESPTPHRTCSRAPTGGYHQYTEQPSRIEDHEDAEIADSKFEENSFVARYNGMDLDGNVNCEVEDENIFTSPTARRHHNVTDSNIQPMIQPSMEDQLNLLHQYTTQDAVPQSFAMAYPGELRLRPSREATTLSKSITQMNSFGSYHISPWGLTPPAFDVPPSEPSDSYIGFQSQSFSSTISESSSGHHSVEESTLREALSFTQAPIDDFMIPYAADDLLIGLSDHRA
ncbi:hypothetical protein G7Z17_g11215 [Cylindrodendrum hubeiense]|uniref:Uncharacterized protein n=1 Tax=Cylindrodendrum hubeiense TaxID=595255 RepID=A0A9P5GZZ4_9HYPO|nr:hypothetical protein G7Z17_g11215 [Cylindrodendrum hubeiense]